MKPGEGPAESPSATPWLRTGTDCITVEVAARPGSPKRGIIKSGEQGLVVGLGSAAERGKANEELIGFFATLTKVSRSAVTIVRGGGSRHKVVRITTADPDSTAGRLLEASSLSSDRRRGE